jgi:hypothetical protein
MFKNEKDFRFWLDKAYRDGASNQEIVNVLRETYYGMTEIPDYVKNFLNQNCGNNIRPTRKARIAWHKTYATNIKTT